MLQVDKEVFYVFFGVWKNLMPLYDKDKPVLNGRKNMNALLEFGENYIEFDDLRFYPEETERGNPYNCTVKIKVKSNGFMGVSPCEFDMRNLIDFTNELKKMYEFKAKEAKIQEIGYGGMLHFSADNIGHIRISGDIFGEAMIHELKFEFEADQTALLRFISELHQFADN